RFPKSYEESPGWRKAGARRPCRLRLRSIQRSDDRSRRNDPLSDLSWPTLRLTFGSPRIHEAQPSCPGGGWRRWSWPQNRRAEAMNGLFVTGAHFDQIVRQFARPGIALGEKSLEVAAMPAN